MRVIFVGDSTVRYLYLSLILSLTQNATDWGGCERHCPWNERTFSNWTDFYALTSKNMFCDCVRVGCCRKGVVENRYATVRGNALDFFQFFGDMTVKGNWVPGEDDTLRRPHATYSPRWHVHVNNLSDVVAEPYDLAVWNMGHHRCGPAAEFDAVHAALHRVAKRVVFMTTIGLRPCRVTPSRAALFDTAAFHFTRKTNYWDRMHLNGLENLKLATALWHRLLAPTFSVDQR